jgi:adenosylcobinamide-GDP ribazoletransferase
MSATPDLSWGSAFAEAWRLLVDLPLPKSRLFAEHDFDEEDGHRVLAAFPVVGAVLGLAAWSLVWILDRFLTPSAVAAVAAPVVVVGLEWAVQGRNFTALATLCAVRLRRADDDEEAPSASVPALQTPFGMIMFMGLFVLRVLAVGVLIRWGLSFWLVVTLALAAQVQGCLAVLPDLRSSQPLLSAEPAVAAESSWTMAIVLALLATILLGSFTAFPAALLACLVAWGCARLAARTCERRFGGVTGELAGAAASAAEFALLLTGLLLLVRD